MNNRTKIFLIVGILITIAVVAIMLIIPNLSTDKKIVYTVLFNTGTGEIIEQTVEAGEKVVLPQEPTKEGYVFIGWKYEGNTFDFSEAINENITLVAEWEKISENIKSYVVKFNTDGGTTIENQVIVEGNKILSPQEPTKEGHVFKGWFLADQEYNFELVVNQDLELIAKWEKIPTTSNNNNNSNQVIKLSVPTLKSVGGSVGVSILSVVAEGPYATLSNTKTAKGWELYEKVGSKYKLIKSQEGFKDIQITVDVGESKTYVARVYALNKAGNKVYSGYSNEFKLDNSKIITPTLTNATGHATTGVIKAKLEIVAEGAYSTEGSTNGITGWELYEKVGSEYKLVKSQEGFSSIQVTVDVGETKTYVAKAYALNKSGKKVYSAYSNEFKLDNSKITTPTLTNATGHATIGVINAKLEIVAEGAYSTEGSTNGITGWELYEKVGSEYKLVKSQEGFSSIQVTVDVGETKTYVATVYTLNKAGNKVYSGYSNEFKLDNSKITTPTLTNATGHATTGVINAKLEIVAEGAYSTEGSTNGITGWELYEKVGSEYKLVKSQEGFSSIQVTVDVGETKTYVATVYALNKAGNKVYSGYSNEYKLDNNV